MFDRQTYALLLDFYKNVQLKLDYLCSKTKHDEKASPSKYISALKRAGMISGWESEAVINDQNDREWLGFEITLAGRAYVEKKGGSCFNSGFRMQLQHLLQYPA